MTSSTRAWCSRSPRPPAISQKGTVRRSRRSGQRRGIDGMPESGGSVRPREYTYLIAVLALLLLAACAEQPVAEADVPCRSEGCKPGEYLVGPGDVLHISVWKDASLDRVVTVRP